MSATGQNLEGIALACATECRRQSVGLDRLASLLTGYVYAVDRAVTLPSEKDLLCLAGVIEPVTGGRYRSTPVTFATGVSAARASVVPGAMARIFALLDTQTDAEEFVFAFLKIHPFVDGNGRLAFLLLNWLECQLDDPRALPDFPFV